MKVKQEKARREFADKLTAMHTEAHRLGLNRTGRKLHSAVQECGWELAGEPTPKWQHELPPKD